MLIERELKLISPLLALKMNNQSNPARREFVKKPGDGGVYIRSDLPRWHWAFMEARDAMEMLDVSVLAILPSVYYWTKATSTYNRNFRRGRIQGKEAFEAIPSGSIIKCRFTLANSLPPDADDTGRFSRPPDEVEFDRLLSHIGEHLGMSEWGHAYMYGRFELRRRETPPAS